VQLFLQSVCSGCRLLVPLGIAVGVYCQAATW
jgi:hypothetical protein